MDTEDTKTSSKRVVGLFPDVRARARPCICAGVSFKPVGLLGPALRSRSLLATGMHGQGWLLVTTLPNMWTSWARKKFLVVVGCGLAAVSGVVWIVNPMSRFCGAVW